MSHLMHKRCLKGTVGRWRRHEFHDQHFFFPFCNLLLCIKSVFVSWWLVTWSRREISVEKALSISVRNTFIDWSECLTRVVKTFSSNSHSGECFERSVLWFLEYIPAQMMLFVSSLCIVQKLSPTDSEDKQEHQRASFESPFWRLGIQKSVESWESFAHESEISRTNIQEYLKDRVVTTRTFVTDCKTLRRHEITRTQSCDDLRIK